MSGYGEYEEIARETDEALAEVAQAASHLAQQEVSWRGADGDITVRVTAGGVVTDLVLAPVLLRRYDSVTLGDKVAETLRTAQLKARKEFEEALEASVPERVWETERFIRDSSSG